MKSFSWDAGTAMQLCPVDKGGAAGAIHKIMLELHIKTARKHS
jgi:hypothetical protein